MKKATIEYCKPIENAKLWPNVKHLQPERLANVVLVVVASLHCLDGRNPLYIDELSQGVCHLFQQVFGQSTVRVGADPLFIDQRLPAAASEVKISLLCTGLHLQLATIAAGTINEA